MEAGTMETRGQLTYHPSTAGVYRASYTVPVLSKRSLPSECTMHGRQRTSKVECLFNRSLLKMITSAWRGLHIFVQKTRSTIIAGGSATQAPLSPSKGTVERVTVYYDNALSSRISTVFTTYRALDLLKHCPPFQASGRLSTTSCTRRLKGFPLLVIAFLGCLVTVSSGSTPQVLLGTSQEIRRSKPAGGQQYQQTSHHSVKGKPSRTDSKKIFAEDELKHAGEAYHFAEQVIQNLESRGISVEDDKIDDMLQSAIPQLQLLGIDVESFEEAFRQIVARESELASQANLEVEQISQRLTELAQRLEELRERPRLNAGQNRSLPGVPSSLVNDAFTTSRQTGQSRAMQYAAEELDHGSTVLNDIKNSASLAKGKRDRFVESLPSHELELEDFQDSVEDGNHSMYWDNEIETDEEATEEDQSRGGHAYAHMQNPPRRQMSAERTVSDRRKGVQVGDGRGFLLFRDGNTSAQGLPEHQSLGDNTPEESELQGQQMSLTLRKSIAGKSGLVDKDVELILDHHRPPIPQCGNNNGRPPARPTVPFVAASYDAPGASAVALLARFRNDSKLLVEVFAESVIDSLPPDLKRRWRVTPEEVELYSIKDCDLTIYVHCNYYVGRPDPNLGTPLVCSCAKAPSSANTSHAAAVNNNSHVRIEWNLLDFSRRGRKATTEIVRAVNVDMQKKGRSAFMNNTLFGRTLSTVMGYPVRTAMAYYSIGVADRPGCRNRPCGPLRAEPGSKLTVPPFPHIPSLPHPRPGAPRPPAPGTNKPDKPSHPQLRLPTIPIPRIPSVSLRPPLVPPPPNPLDCVFVGIDFFGFDVAKDETGEVQSASECAERCKFELTCFYWTFNQRRRWCYLKNALAPLGKYQDPVMTNSLVSGIKGCNILPDAYPSDTSSAVGLCDGLSEPCYVLNVNIVTDPKGYNRCVQHCRTPLDCHAACVMDPACFYWVFDETRRVCTVKGRKLLEPTRVEGTVDTIGLTSGAKRCPIDHAGGIPRRLMEETQKTTELPPRRSLGTVRPRHDNTCAFLEGDLHPTAHDTLESGRAKHPTECRTRCVTHAVNTFNSRNRSPYPVAKERDRRGSAAKMPEECVFWRFDWNNGTCTLLGRDAWRTWKAENSKNALVGTHRCRQFSSLYPPLSALDLCYQEYIIIVPEPPHLRLSVVPEVTDPGQCDLLCASQSKCISWTLQKAKKVKNSSCMLFEGSAHKRKTVSPAYHLQHSYPNASPGFRYRSNKVTAVSGLLGARRCSQESMTILLSDASVRRNTELPVSPGTSENAPQHFQVETFDSPAPRTAAAALASASRTGNSPTEMRRSGLATMGEAVNDYPIESPEVMSPASWATPNSPQTGAMPFTAAAGDSFSLPAVWTGSPNQVRRSGLHSSSAAPASPTQSLTKGEWPEQRQQQGSPSHARLDNSISLRVPPCAQAGLEYVGHDLLPRASTPKSLSPTKCHALCAGTRLCFFWTYDAQSRLCYLKDVNAPSHARHGQSGALISGTKYCPPLWASQAWAYGASGYSPVSGTALGIGVGSPITQGKDDLQDGNANVQEDQPSLATQPSVAQEKPASEGDSSVLWSALSGRAWSTPALFASWLPAFSSFEAPSHTEAGGFLAKSGATSAGFGSDHMVVAQPQAAPQKEAHDESSSGKRGRPSSAHLQARQQPEYVLHQQVGSQTSQSSLDAATSLLHREERTREVNTQEESSDPVKSPNTADHDHATPRRAQNVSSPNSPLPSSDVSAATVPTARPSDMLEPNEPGGATASRRQLGPSLKCKEAGVALLGSDLAIVGPIDGMGGTGAVETPAQCALFCIHNAGCRYWSLDTKNRTCYLKPSGALQYYTRNENTKDFISGPALGTEDCPLNLFF